MIKNKEAEILLLGLPNSGKSTLINALTKNKTSIIGSKPNTTRAVSYTHLTLPTSDLV